MRHVRTTVGSMSSFFLRFLIVVLFWVAFQPLGMAQQSLNVPVLDLSGSASQDNSPLLQALKVAGYTPFSVPEHALVHRLSGRKTPYLVVSLGQRLSERHLSLLQRYVTRGGQLVLIPPTVVPEPSVMRLYRVLGLNVQGTASVSQALPLSWHDFKTWGTSKEAPATLSDDALAAGSTVLSIRPTTQDGQVLATWGREHPALIATSRGAALNWQLGKELSSQANAEALRRVIRPDLFAWPEAGLSPSLVQPVLAQSSPSIQPESTTQVASASSEAAVEPVVAAGSTPGVESKPEETPVNNTAPQLAAAASEPSPLAVVDPAPDAAPVKASEAIPAPSATTPTHISEADVDREMLGTILGVSPEETAALSSDAPSAPSAPEAAPRKPFSFLDPEARSVLAPPFDPMVHTNNVRMLETYRQRVQDALETDLQLGLGLPVERIKTLLDESAQHQRQFETLYLDERKTLDGLEALRRSRRAMLKAYALSTPSPKVESRVIWLDRGSIVSAGGVSGLRRLMQKLHQAGINVVYFETFNAGFPIYPSKLTRHNPLVRNWDPLKVAVEEGHRLGMEVHAWVWVFAVGNKRHNPLIGKSPEYAGPVLEDGGLMDDALRGRASNLSVDGRQHEYWLSPASPKARQFLLDLYREIVTEYAVDGVHLDYIRYPFQNRGTRMGYEPVSLERFRQATGLSPDAGDYAARMWIAWKTHQVSSFVKEVSDTLKGMRPELKISAAVFPMRRESRIVAIQQDWETWIDNGWVDSISPMSYTRDVNKLKGLFDYVQSSSQKRTLVYPGIAIGRLDGGQLVSQLEALREKGGLGATLFAGAHLDEEKIEALSLGPFKRGDTLPPHRNPIQSLMTIVGDYEEKFGRLKSAGALKESPSAVEQAVAEFSQSLKSLTPAPATAGIPSDAIQRLQKQFQAFQGANSAWTATERSEHPFRAQYFDKKMRTLGELMRYLSSRGSVAAGTPADEQPSPASVVVTNADEEVTPPDLEDENE